MGAVIEEVTLDDLLRSVVEFVLDQGERTLPTKGPALDTWAASLRLTNPRARLSRTEGRGRLFSALGELCWYLSGSNDTDHIAHYIRAYRKCDEAGKVHGGYGPRLFDADGSGQVDYVIKALRANPWTRKAVIQLFDRSDVAAPHEDVPCTCTLQFLIREGRLHLITYMRSNDAWLGLPHDIFCFTMLQELVAVSTGYPLGEYQHFVGSLHLYEANFSEAEHFMGEGWQSTFHEMAPMPEQDPWSSIETLLDLERDIREGATLTAADVEQLDDYWADLARILAIHARAAVKDLASIEELRSQLRTRTFDLFVDDRLERL
ncbi:thymidylate synthase [Phycicoccus flavus]|uniref:thymidylate synthase n=1 Tax=Phycicoccus flavus TaxID=2502783 RepID=UPI000FEC1F57|nr:thymidylate synthase [Phycicoccus flavus]NHA68638.1 thymidylate synthase [Phycicoccus flavus]